jgi:hypothetical protein
LSSKFVIACFIVFSKSASTSFTCPTSSGTFPSKYLLTIETVLFKRFEKSFTKSKLYLSTKPSGVKIPSDETGICLIKKYFVASKPYLAINCSG